jgi:hypothetical protein
MESNTITMRLMQTIQFCTCSIVLSNITLRFRDCHQGSRRRSIRECALQSGNGFSRFA